MKRYRCPDAGHGETVETLKANNDRVYECPKLHKYWRQEDEGRVVLADLITGKRYDAQEVEASGEPAGPDRPRLNFMVDVPRLTGGMDFNALSLSPAQWKVISRIDGTSTIEEVRLLAGLTAAGLERAIYELVDAGLVEVKRRGGR
jgi:hypothetical protein